MKQHLDPDTIRTLRDYEGSLSTARRVRGAARSGWMRLVGTVRPSLRVSRWIRFPYYHHVFDDERTGFSSHLRYFRNLGDFVTLDDAVALLRAPGPVAGRFFCLSFDDGFRNNFTNAVPILLEHRAVAAFFVPTARIKDQRSWNSDEPAPHASPTEPAYLTWDECRAMISAGMTIGSHSVTHARLCELDDADLEMELRDSKVAIEGALKAPCRHFACPWGRPGIDFSREREPIAASNAGYKSFLTTQRGSGGRRPHPLMIERDQLRSDWPRHQLHYFFDR